VPVRRPADQTFGGNNAWVWLALANQGGGYGGQGGGFANSPWLWAALANQNGGGQGG
jgi:hypothetical protein